MKTIQEIFDNAIFRIPDYQRGYSWQEQHLTDFWQDINNIRTRQDKYHFTGTITVEQATREQYLRWVSDKWIIEGLNFKPFLIVDGQQRITTIVILIASIIEKLDDEEQLLYQNKLQLTDKYLFRQDSKKIEKSYMFGYEIDNPSDEFFKSKILGQYSQQAYNQSETSYTNNLEKAKKFFDEKIKGYTNTSLDNLLKTVTQQLKFDLKIVEDDLDTFLVFETMNNRGKSLSNLEKLKNRLIYLSTLMPLYDTQKERLRIDINQAWKTIYENLGKNKEKPLNDDDFLRAHWIVYEKYERGEANFIEKEIFSRVFSSNNKELKYSELIKYIESISRSAVEWYKVFNPEQGNLTPELVKWLVKLNRMGFGQFQPLILSAFISDKCDETMRIKLLKSIEKYIFLVFLVSNRKSDAGSYTFLRTANDFFENRFTINDVVNEIERLIWGERGFFSVGHFENNLQDLFKRDEGFYKWNGLSYFLHEYEESLRDSHEELKVKWNKGQSSIEHIFPQSIDRKNCWDMPFDGFDDSRRKILCNNLGNLLLLSSHSKNSSLSNKCFNEKRKYTNSKGIDTGYFNGSYSEIEVSQYEDWTPQTILERGLKLLAFLEKRWAIDLGGKRKKMDILNLNFMLEE